MSTLPLVKTYYLSALIYGCEAWTLTYMVVSTKSTLLETTVFDEYFYGERERARILDSSFGNRCQFLFAN